MSESSSPFSKVLRFLKPEPAAHKIYLCEGPNCCTAAQSEASWKHLKERLRERGLDSGERRVKAIRTDCRGVCGNGPIAVVYPEKTWYWDMSPRNLDRVIDEHFIGGRPAAGLCFEPSSEAREPE